MVEDGVTYSRANPVVQINVTAYIGARYGQFPIDLARQLHLFAAPERVRARPVVEIPGLPGLPELVVYPLPDQVADKVCAMYERHGPDRAPSSRYRDLLDLALIVTTCQLDGWQVARAVASETSRRGMSLPAAMTSPGPDWPAGYAAIARHTRLPTRLHQIPAALQAVGACLNPILSRERSTGTWHPTRGWTT